MSRRPQLYRLADRLGVQRQYRPAGAKRAQAIADDALAAAATALGYSAGTEGDAREALKRLDSEARARRIDPVQFIPADSQQRLTLPRIAGAGHAEIVIENDERPETPIGCALSTTQERIRVHVPALAPGRYRMHILRSGNSKPLASSTLFATPATCVSPKERLDDQRGFGLWCNLYSLSRKQDLGAGDLGHLRELVDFAGAQGADFVGVNPLHVLDAHGRDVSPYSPVSRLFRHPLYIDIPTTSGFSSSEAVRADYAREAQSLTGVAHQRIDYPRTLALRDDLLSRLFANVIGRNQQHPHRRAFDAFWSNADELLKRFATFQALREHFGRSHGTDWRRWPTAFRDPESNEVQRFSAEHDDRITYHAWLQFELDRQLAAIAQRADDGGMGLGLYQDLAVGSAPDGFDTWAFPGLFVQGASVGAPPDDYVREGQSWGLPPVNPLRLRASGYAYWQRLLEANLAHAGALRIDHILGLFRQWWVPSGSQATNGAYVGFPATELLALIALASRRSNAVIIGEDLGTVAPEVPARLARYGILSSRVMLFEREHGGRFRPAQHYSPRALTTANTHDHPTLKGWWQGHDLELRRRIDRGGSPKQQQRDEAQRNSDRRHLLQRLRRDKLLAGTDDEPTHLDLCAAVYRFLARTPSPLVGLSVDDLAGETEPVNLPGAGPADYPSWTRRMSTTVQALDCDALRHLLKDVKTQRALAR